MSEDEIYTMNRVKLLEALSELVEKNAWLLVQTRQEDNDVSQYKYFDRKEDKK